MKRMLGMLIGLAFTAGAFAWAMAWPARDHSYRYRLTVEVMTPQGLRRGAAVREFTWRRLPKITAEARSARTAQRGEAVSVQLPGGRNLYLLLDDEPAATPLMAFYNAGEGSGQDRIKAAARAGGVFTMPHLSRFGRGRLRHLPTFVTFRENLTPESIEWVDPRDLSATLGSGYALSKITAEVVDEPITRQVERQLPWLATIARERASILPDVPILLREQSASQRIRPGAFSTELRRPTRGSVPAALRGKPD